MGQRNEKAVNPDTDNAFPVADAMGFMCVSIDLHGLLQSQGSGSLEPDVSIICLYPRDSGLACHSQYHGGVPERGQGLPTEPAGRNHLLGQLFPTWSVYQKRSAVCCVSSVHLQKKIGLSRTHFAWRGHWFYSSPRVAAEHCPRFVNPVLVSNLRYPDSTTFFAAKSTQIVTPTKNNPYTTYGRKF